MLETNTEISRQAEIDEGQFHAAADTIRLAYWELKNSWEIKLPIEQMKELYDSFCSLLFSPFMAHNSKQIISILTAWNLNTFIRDLCNQIESALELHVGQTWQ